MEWIRHARQDARLDDVMALYRESFPVNEQRLPEDHLRALADPGFFCESAWEGGELLGLLFSWELPGMTYVEHFAVSAHRRGCGVGSALMRDFCANHPLVVLEIDPPDAPAAQRRQRFYEALGFTANGYAHRHPPYRAGFAPHPLVVMTWPRRIAAEEYGAFAAALQGRVMRYAQRQAPQARTP